MSQKTKSLDPINFEILRNKIRAIANEASLQLERVAFSPIIAEAHDAGTAILTSDGRLISNSFVDMLPHVGTFEFKIKMILEDLKDKFMEGDVIITNDPHRGGTHTNDVALARPIFHKGELFAFTLSTSHWLDVGGPIPGTFNPLATESYSEGLLIPPMKIWEKDEPVQSFFNLIKRNIRMYEATLGDIYGQYQACVLADRRIKETIERYGAETVNQVFEEIMNHTERLLRAEVRKIPDGEWEFEDYGDYDILDRERGPIKIHCKATKKDDNVNFDFSKSDKATKASWGFSRAGTHSAAYAATMYYFPELAPMNHGLVRSLTIQTVPGSVVDLQYPAPCSGYCSGAYEKVQHVVMGCWANMFVNYKPMRIIAGTANLSNCVIGGYTREGRQHVAYFCPEGGYGARTFKDGNSFLFWLYAGTGKQEPVEVIERWNPVLYTDVDVFQDSCGDGEFRGGFGIIRNWIALEEMKITNHGDRSEVTPYGLGGGTNGGPNVLYKTKPRFEDLGVHITGAILKPGEAVFHGSNGGGGYGDPLERDPKRVLEDVLDGYISLKKAREVYGVAIIVRDEEALDYEIDYDETKKLRARKAETKVVKNGYGPGEKHPWGSAIVVPKLVH